MGVSPPAHPADRTLAAFGLGKLDDDAAATVSTHVAECARCRARVGALSADRLVGRLREAGEGPRESAGQSLAAGDRGVRDAQQPPPPIESLPPGLADHPDYAVERVLGRGGMGVVYLARNRLMDRREVLKVVGPQITGRSDVLDRFLREIRAVARLRHPNIVTAYSAVRVGESLVFTMEYVDGLDLARLVRAKGPLPVGHACYFIYQAALGLQHAHEEGLVHRDIKPANLILARKGTKATVKLLDFGLAKAAREEKVDSGLTSEGQMLGTPDFIAPEQVLDAPSADIRADVYSLGGTLYYLLAGTPPFRADSLYDLYQSHISRAAEPLNLVRPEVPAELAAVVARMMAKDPGRRFQTPREVADALAPFFKRADVVLDRAGNIALETGATRAGESVAAAPGPESVAARAPHESHGAVRAESPATPAPGVPDSGPVRSRRTRALAVATSVVALIGVGAAVVALRGENERARAARRTLVGDPVLDRKSPATPDLLQEGTIWKGVWSRLDGYDWGDVLSVELRVGKREGNAFEGVTKAIGHETALAFKGKILGDAVSWEMTAPIAGAVSQEDGVSFLGKVVGRRVDGSLEWRRPSGQVRRSKGFLLYGGDSGDVFTVTAVANEKGAHVGARSPDAPDPFAPGSVWCGIGTHFEPTQHARDFPVVIRVKRREGNTFEGTYGLGDERRVAAPIILGLNGTTDGDAVEITTSGDVEFAGVPMKGVTRGDRVDFDFAYGTAETERARGKLVLVRDAGTAPGDDGRPPTVTGRWRHRAGRGPFSERVLNPDGICAFAGTPVGTWKLEGSQLTLTWPAANAPGGAWVDTVLVSQDGTRYEGRNQHGLPIVGARPE